MEEDKPNYFAIIPANVRYDDELTEKAKLLYGEITCLSNKEGYCFALNNYFAKLYKCSTRTIQNSIIEVLEKYDMLYTQEILKFMKPENIEKVKIVCYSLAMTVKENVSHLLYKKKREQIMNLYDECKLREKEYKNTENDIKNFSKYFYKSLKAQLLKGTNPSFFVSENNKFKNVSTSEKEVEER